MDISKKIIERVTLTGKMNERHEAYNYCNKNQYRIISQGPKWIAEYKDNPDIYVMVAEREKEVK